MIDKSIDILSKTSNDRNRAILNILRFLFTFILSIIVYELFFGKFDLIPLNKYEEIILFFVKGEFLVPIVIFTCTWHLFFTVLDFIITKYMLKSVNYLALVTPNLSSTLNKENIKNNKILKYSYTILLKALLETSLIRIKDKAVVGGYSLSKIITFLGKIEKGEDDIDIDFIIKSFITITQFLILVWIFLFIGDSYNYGFALGVTLIGIVTLIMTWVLMSFATALKLYSKPLKEELLSFEEESNKILAQMSSNKSNAPQEKSETDIELKEIIKEEIKLPQNAD